MRHTNCNIILQMYQCDGAVGRGGARLVALLHNSMRLKVPFLQEVVLE
jgi:hypothetical protein